MDPNLIKIRESVDSSSTTSLHVIIEEQRVWSQLVRLK